MCGKQFWWMNCRSDLPWHLDYLKKLDSFGMDPYYFGFHSSNLFLSYILVILIIICLNKISHVRSVIGNKFLAIFDTCYMNNYN